MPNFVLVGFDKWCRIKSGLSNAKIAAAISTQEKRYSEEDVRGWRDGGSINDPSSVLLPLRVALKEPWPPATAEEAWVELLEVLSAAVPFTGTPTAAKPAPVLEPTRASAPRPKPAPPKTDPVLEACKADIERAAEELAGVVSLADQVQAGWFTRTAEKLKKYAAGRDMKHRKAYLQYCLQRAETTLEKARSRRADLAAKLAGLGAALGTFDTMQKECTERMERKRDENVALWRELKQAAPQVATARQTFERATSKSLAGLDDVLKRAEAAVTDWKAKHDMISDEGGITLSWVSRDSKIGQRLRLQHTNASWNAEFDPFEGCCICKDKLADSYKVGGSHKQEKPVEIDLACEIDLTVVGLQRRQEAVQAIC
ncbi:hypothetical protein IV102_20935 [bacterium]|nr:hypothetical protein [bacterium]